MNTPTNVIKQLRRMACVALATTTFSITAIAKDPLTVNWYHGAEFMFPLVKAFTAETGIEVKVTNSDDAFDTDVMFVPDYASIHKAAKNGKFSNIRTEKWDRRVPSIWSDDEGNWYGAMVRLRGVVYNPNKVSGESINSVFDLMNPGFKGRICLLEGSYKSNRSFLAQMIAQHGEKRARDWARTVRENMARDWDNDLDNIAHVAEGQCDVALFDNYYYHYMAEGKRTTKYNIPIDYVLAMPKLTDGVKIRWLDQDELGNPANVTAIAVSPNATSREDALKFVDFILSDKGQELVSENLFKYPVVPGIRWPHRLLDEGRPYISAFDLNKLDPYYAKADEIYKQTGWK